MAPLLHALKLSETQADRVRATTLNGSFTDPGTLEAYTVVVDWGDNNSSVTTVDPIRRSFTATHAYALTTPNDSFTVIATVSDGLDSSKASVVSDGTRYEIPIAPTVFDHTAGTRQTGFGPG